MYTLFIGDQDKIPLKTLSITTDYLEYSHGDFWYGCLDGDDDFLAEVAIGRFSTNTLSDFQKMVNKTITYERFYNGNSKNVLLVAHMQEPNNEDFYQACSDTIRNRYSDIMSFSTAYGASGATNSDVINYINNGMNIVNYNGHGNQFSWTTWNTSLENFGSTQIGSMYSPSIFITTGCENGDIRAEPCMMEMLSRSTTGAVACLAAVDNVWRTACNKYDQQLFSHLLIGHYRYLGDLNLMAQVSTIGNYYYIDEIMKNKALFNAQSFLCGGDPTLRLWTSGPYSLTNSDVHISFYDDYISLSVIPFAEYEMSIVSELGELLERIKVYSHSKLFSIPSGNFYVVINKPDYYPYIIFFSSSNYIQNETIYANSFYYYNNTPLSIGYNVTPNKPYGNVTVKSGSKLSIHNGTGGVTISNGFECEKGGELIIE